MKKKSDNHTITMPEERWHELKRYAEGGSVSAFIWRLLQYYKTALINFTGITRHKLIVGARQHAQGNVEAYICACVEIAETHFSSQIEKYAEAEMIDLREEKVKFL